MPTAFVFTHTFVHWDKSRGYEIGHAYGIGLCADALRYPRANAIGMGDLVTRGFNPGMNQPT